jgi:hypothetical protein
MTVGGTGSAEHPTPAAGAEVEALLQGVLEPFVARALAKGGAVAFEGSAGSLPSFVAAAAANDQPTCDLLTQRMDIHEKNAWMLRSLLA